MDRLGKPLPIFQDIDDTNNENEALFKLFESDHDVELVAENIFVAFGTHYGCERKSFTLRGIVYDQRNMKNMQLTM